MSTAAQLEVQDAFARTIIGAWDTFLIRPPNNGSLEWFWAQHINHSVPLATLVHGTGNGLEARTRRRDSPGAVPASFEEGRARVERDARAPLPNLQAADQATFTRAAYQVFLGREPSAQELALWTTAFAPGAPRVWTVAAKIYPSAEAKAYRQRSGEAAGPTSLAEGLGRMNQRLAPKSKITDRLKRAGGGGLSKFWTKLVAWFSAAFK